MNTTNFKSWIGRGLPLAGALLLAGCVVAPHQPYYHERSTVLITPAPRVEYRGRPPAPNYIWVDGYWSRVGSRNVWVTGRWAPPAHRHPPPRFTYERPYERQYDPHHDRTHDRRESREDRRRDNDRDARPYRQADRDLQQHRTAPRAQLERRDAPPAPRGEARPERSDNERRREHPRSRDRDDEERRR